MSSIRARLFAPDLVGSPEAVLEGKDFHYLAHVLRIRPGDRVLLFGSEARESVCEVVEVGAETVQVRLLETRESRTDSPVDLVLVLAVGKGKKLEEVVEATTPLGVRTIVPFVSERSIAKRSNPRLGERLESISLAACRQSGRSAPPEILPVQPDLRTVLGLPVLSTHEGILLDEGGGIPLVQTLDSLSPSARVALFCGPEGGWSPSEREKLLAGRCRPVSLGPRILRTELAAVVAVALLEQVLSSRIDQPSGHEEDAP